MSIHWNKNVICTTLGLGLLLVVTPRIQAQSYDVKTVSGTRCCPQQYAPQYGQSCPDSAHPQDLPDTGDPAPAPEAATPDSQQITPQIAPSAQPQLVASAAGSGANTPMLGRLDSNNRFNMFDNMSAIPKSRVWFGYQLSEGNNTNVTLTPAGTGAMLGTAAGILNRHHQNTYRFGMEYAVSCDLSVAFQGQYVTPFDASGPQEDWTNPQMMVKYVLNRGCQSVLSGTLGYAPEASTTGTVINDDHDRVYPGILYYRQLSDDSFLQAGSQFGIPVHGEQYTWDWALSYGFWAYRHSSIDPCCSCGGGCGCGGYGGGCGSSCGCGCQCDQPCLLGIVPQIELLGKHVIGDTTFNAPSGLPSGGPFIPWFVGEEPRHIMDVTIGTQMILKNNVSIGSGVSFPITGGNARSTEFMATLNYGF